MTKSDANDRHIRMRGWVVAIFAIAIWLILATNSAEAQQVRIPDFILKQVLGERNPAGDSSDAQRRRVELQIVRSDAQPF